MKKSIIRKIKNKSAKVGIIGLGYVGLPNLVTYCQRQYYVTGFDINSERIDFLNHQTSYIDDISDSVLFDIKQKYKATSQFDSIMEQDIIFIDVPTPVDVNKTPNLEYIKTACENFLLNCRKGQIVVLESTVAPGTTYQYLVKPLEERGYIVGKDIFVGYSPERIDPGNKSINFSDIRRVIGGFSKNCLDILEELFLELGHPVSSLEIAELSKLYENTFRFVNIALANEFSEITNKMSLSFDELSEAANTKPFGFMKFNPTYGIGGHCIPVDPFYLVDYARSICAPVELIESAAQVNDTMIYKLIVNIKNKLKTQYLDNRKIAVIGASYKTNIKDIRMAVSHKLVDKLVSLNTHVHVFDNLTVGAKIGSSNIPVLELDYNALSDYDLVIVMQDHDYLDMEKILENNNVLLGTRF